VISRINSDGFFKRERAAMLSDGIFELKLSDYLLSKEIAGLSTFIRSALVRLPRDLPTHKGAEGRSLTIPVPQR